MVVEPSFEIEVCERVKGAKDNAVRLSFMPVVLMPLVIGLLGRAPCRQLDPFGARLLVDDEDLELGSELESAILSLSRASDSSEASQPLSAGPDERVFMEECVWGGCVE